MESNHQLNRNVTLFDVAALPAEDCGVLQGHPNHVFIHPSYFIHCDGPKTAWSSYLAVAIINQLQEQREAEPNDADAQAEVEKEMAAVAPLLAFLWASSKGYLAHVPLVEDPPDNAQLNARCERIRARIREAPLPPAPTGNPRPSGAPPGGMTGVDTANIALAAQTLTIAMTTNESNRVRERDEDRSSKSLISNLGPRQQCLFERLTAESMGDPPAMSAFMVNVLKEKSPAKPAHLLMAEMRKQKGCCTEASIHRFLAYGLMLENTSDLGGLPGLIFVKRSLLRTGSTSAGNEQQRVMEYFDCDMEPQVIVNYLKKEHVIPQDVHQLEVALNTWASFLELCTVRRTIAAQGLRRFLDGMEDIDATLEDMFLVSADFGLKIMLVLVIMLVLNNNLQKICKMVAEARDVTRLGPSERRFLVDRAEGLLQDLRERVPPRIIVPSLLAGTSPGLPRPATPPPAPPTAPPSATHTNRRRTNNRRRSKPRRKRPRAESTPRTTRQLRGRPSPNLGSPNWPTLRGLLPTRVAQPCGLAPPARHTTLRWEDPPDVR
jgi:hypothetical protein